MNPHEPDQPLSEHPDAEPVADAVDAPKPRRRRAAPKIDADGVTGPATAADPPAGASLTDAAPGMAVEPPAKAKPRSRRKPAEAEAGAAAAPAASVASAGMTAEIAQAPRPASAPPTSPVVLGDADAAPSTRGDVTVGAGTALDADGDAAAGGAGGDSTGAGEGSEGPRRRNRNRRRGRRNGADRLPRDASAGPAADADAASLDGQRDGEGDHGGENRDRRAPSFMPRTAPVDSSAAFADVLSGVYDSEPAALPGAAPGIEAVEPVEPVEVVGAVEATSERRVLAAEPDAPKLHKLLAQAGIGSRRDMEQLITDGRVTVNGQVAHIGQRISFGDQVRVAGKPVKLRIAPPLPRVIAYHKPVGEVVTNDDPQQRPTVFRRLPRLTQGKWQSVGRLDINTEGLLLFTNAGGLANQLMHPSFGVEREYAVRVLGALDDTARSRLLEGVEIDGQRAAFKSIDDGGGEGVNHWYRVVITEGRNREVRKLFDRVGLGVSRLIRIRYGCVVLPRGLRRGAWVDLNEQEVRELRRAAGARDGRDGRDDRQARDRIEPEPARRGPGAEAGGQSRGNKRRGGQQRGAGRPERGPDRPVERSADRDFDPGFDRPEPGEGGPIPNPLQQTFDKRAIREARQPRREYAEDGPIPNPLEQTYDKRFVQKPRGPGGGGRKGGGGGAGGAQPDPMKTSLGYIGADAFVRQFNSGGGGGGGGGRGGRRRGGGR